ncbi:hypothetical protein [Thiocapsa sp. N5-Cardenillas]|uniref:hypothetical protein n=1 Tax=Thiocapsa sp. N5-Cardenillas TaxID=3137397 RepID=UPI0035B08D46
MRQFIRSHCLSPLLSEAQRDALSRLPDKVQAKEKRRLEADRAFHLQAGQGKSKLKRSGLWKPDGPAPKRFMSAEEYARFRATPQHAKRII